MGGDSLQVALGAIIPGTPDARAPLWPEEIKRKNRDQEQGEGAGLAGLTTAPFAPDRSLVPRRSGREAPSRFAIAEVSISGSGLGVWAASSTSRSSSIGDPHDDQAPRQQHRH